MPDAILLDIEGTTTSIDFVLETLFPYSKERIAKYVELHFDALKPEINQLVEESSHDDKYTMPVDPAEPGSVSSYLEFLIGENRKSTPLKTIQGRIWQEGYKSGELLSHVFDDVPRALERWAVSGKKIAIFSSGSILAQQLLFRHTHHGDLTTHIVRYFDTTTGPKREPESYTRIAKELGYSPQQVTFLSDIPEELAAAAKAGMEAVLVIRTVNKAVDDTASYRVVTSFDDVDLN